MTVAVGQLLDEQGLAMQISKRAVPSNHRGRNFDVETRTSFRATPALNVRARQAERIPIGIGHDRQARIGQVVHLEMRGRHLWAVAELDYEIGEGPWQLSVETTSSYQRGSSIGDDVEITGVGIVARSAQTNLAPIKLLDGNLTTLARRVTYQDGIVGVLIKNAAEVLRDRRQNRPIQVRGLLDPDQEEAMLYAHAREDHYRSNPHERPRRNPGGLEHSQHRGRIISVR